MKKLLLIIFITSQILGFVANAQIKNYAWPNTVDLLSDRYEIKIRQVNLNGSTGQWIVQTAIISNPRDYAVYKSGFPASEFNANGHNRVGEEAMPGYMQDRNMTFAMFEFAGKIEVEVKKLFGSLASRVEVSPKAFGINPHFFDGQTVRFYMDKPNYVSVDFNSTDNRDDDGFGGKDIKYSCMIFGDKPESTAGYVIPKITDPGVVVWNNNTNLSTLLAADIIYFPAGDYNLKDHKDNISDWYYSVAQYDGAKLYHGKLNLAKDGQKVYLAPGAYVRGAFHSDGHKNNWLYGRGVVSGRNHLMHEIIRPVDGANGILYVQTTQSKEAFCAFGDGAVFNGVVFAEPFHHTCPSGKNSRINNIKIIGWCYNNDGIRPSGGSIIDGIFIKSCDDYDYARDPHTVSNSVFWPGVNGAVGQLGWSDLGSGYAEYYNNYIINSEWNNPAKDNVGIINGSKASAGIKLTNNIFQNLYLEGTVDYLVNSEINSGTAAGYLKNFTIKNVSVEKMFQTTKGVITKQKMAGLGGTVIQDWTFTNLFVAGVLVTQQNYQNYFNLNLDAQNNDNSRLCKNIIFNSIGAIHTITVSNNTGGSYSPIGNAGIIQIASGMDQLITITPISGKKIVNVIIDGVSKGRIQNYKFTSVNSNHTVVIEFGTGIDYYDNSTSDPNVSPTVSLTATPVAATAPATIGLTATAADANGTVSNVKFYNGTTLLTTDTTAPFTFSWLNVAAGTYTLTAQATDNEGAVTTSTAVMVVVSNSVPQTFDITDLTAVATSCNSVRLTWSDVSGEDAYRVRRRLSSETAYIILADVAADVTNYIDATAIEGISYAYMVRPMQAGVTVKVSNTPIVTTPICYVNQAPTAIISSPQTTTLNYFPTTVTLNATATDDVGVDKVEFYNGTTLLGTDATAPYSYVWINPVVGTYSNIIAKSYDVAGLIGTSTAITIKIDTVVTSVDLIGNGITGPVCVTTNQSILYTVSPEFTQAYRVTWWTNSGAIITSNATDMYKTQVEFPAYMQGSTVTLIAGVNFNVAPWYKEYTMSVKVGGCSTQNLRVAAVPQPFDQTTVLTTANQEVINTVLVYDVRGILVDSDENVSMASYELGANLPSGMYIVHVYSNDDVYVVKVVKR